MRSEERGEGGEGNTANARLYMFRPNATRFLKFFGEGGQERPFFCLPLTLISVCVSVQLLWLQHTVALALGQTAPPPPSRAPLRHSPTSSPHVCPCIWEVKHVCDITRTTRNADGMEWSQPQPRRAPRLTGRERKRGGRRKRRRGGGGKGEKRQAGMKVRKPSLVKEPTKTKNGKKKNLFFVVLTVKSSNNHLMNVMFCHFL